MREPPEDWNVPVPTFAEILRPLLICIALELVLGAALYLGTVVR